MNKSSYTCSIRSIIVAGAILFIFGLVVGGSAGRWLTPEADGAPPSQRAEAEYYRGVYDLCVEQIHRFDICLRFTRKMIGAEWYKKSSSGWEWPPAVDDSVALGH